MVILNKVAFGISVILIVLAFFLQSNIFMYMGFLSVFYQLLIVIDMLIERKINKKVLENNIKIYEGRPKTARHTKKWK